MFPQYKIKYFVTYGNKVQIGIEDFDSRIKAYTRLKELEEDDSLDNVILYHLELNYRELKRIRGKGFGIKPCRKGAFE